jgi:DNA-binding LacI/PurR family transcriptional regulator
MQSMKHTIHDVAKLAGVGIGTVSRVLNNHPNVKPATREKVLTAIEQLHFKPNPIARSMILRRTGALGVIIPFFTRPFHVEVLRAIHAAIDQAGFELILYNVENRIQRDHYFTDLPMLHKVDGLCIVSLPIEDNFILDLQRAKLPVVLIDAYNSHATSLVVDNVDGAYQATSCLIKQGHKHIGFINGLLNEGSFKFGQAHDRLVGFRQALSEYGIGYDPQLVRSCDWSRQAGKDAAIELLSLPEPPDAIFAASDIQAIGALEAARELRRAVPYDLSIIGFDGIEFSELLGISTILQPIQEISQIGVQKLCEHMTNPDMPPELIHFSTRLVERQTTARYSSRSHSLDSGILLT